MESLPFYEASLRALRFVEARTPTGRRFGADAEAMWRNFRGHLTAADRIELLLRDAEAEFPGAFGARVAFALRGVGEDDAFGAAWERPAAKDVDELFRHVAGEAPPGDAASAIAACARAWGVAIAPLDLGRITPNTRLLLAGPSAFASAAAAFAGGAGLAWGDQVTCVATPPPHRHLAGLCAALLGSAKPTRIVAAGDPLPRGERFDTGAVADDADAADRDAVAGMVPTGS